MEKNTSTKSIVKIAVIGPESTGKSELSEQLAAHYNTLRVPEYARKYCTNLNRECTLADELAIFRGQLLSEEEALTKLKKVNKLPPRLLICDTTIITVKIWCEHVFGFCPDEVEQEYQQRKYDVYLLMDIDLPWEEDPLRDFPHLRTYFMEWYIRLMKEKQANFIIISGSGDARKQKALQAIESFLDSLS